MKNILSLLVLSAFFSVAASAQSKGEKAVAAAVERLNNAIINPDRAILEDIASAELTYGHSGGKLQNKAEFVEDLVNGAFDFLTIKIENQKITMAGKNAVVRHTFISKATNAGVPVDLNIGNVLVYKKEHGKWKLLARQAFKIPGT